MEPINKNYTKPKRLLARIAIFLFGQVVSEKARPSLGKNMSDVLEGKNKRMQPKL